MRVGRHAIGVITGQDNCACAIMFHNVANLEIALALQPGSRRGAGLLKIPSSEPVYLQGKTALVLEARQPPNFERELYNHLSQVGPISCTSVSSVIREKQGNMRIFMTP